MFFPGSRTDAVQSVLLLGFAVASMIGLGVSANAWQRKSPLSLQQVESLLNVHLPDESVAAEISDRGLAFKLTRAVIARLIDDKAGPRTQTLLSHLLPQTIATLSTLPPSPYAELKIGENRYSADETGKFTIADLDPGTYEASFVHQGFPEQQRLTIAIGDGTSSRTVTVRPSPRMLAKDVYDQAVQLKDDDPRRLQLLDEAIRIDSNFADAYLVRGIAKGWLKRCQEAIPDFDRAIQLNPKSAEAFFNRGSCDWNLQDFTQAIQDLSRSLEISGGRAAVLALRGRAYNSLGDTARAESDLRQAIGLGAQDYQTYHELGMVLFAQQRWADSIAFFDKAIAVKSDYWPSFLYRGEAKQAIGQTIEGYKDLSRSAEIRTGTPLPELSRPISQDPPKKQRKR